MPQEREPWRIPLALAAAGFVHAGLFSAWTPLNFHQATSLDVPLGALLQGLLCLGLGALFLRTLRHTRRLFRFSLLSGLCSLCVVLDRSFLLQGNWNLLLGSLSSFLTALWLWAALTLTFWAVVRELGDLFLRALRTETRIRVSQQRRSIPRFFSYAGLLLLCWLPHIVMQYPGHIETTAGQQIREAFGDLPLTDDNPLFHTLLVKALIKIPLALGFSDTAAVFCLSLSQLLPLAAALAWTVRILERRGLPPILTRGLLVFYGLCPLFPLYGLFIVKDVPFAIAVLLFTCALAEAALQGDAFAKSGWNLTLLFTLGLAVCLLRNVAAMLYGLSMLALLAGVRLTKASRFRLSAVFAATLLVYAGFLLGARALLDVQTLDTRQAETRSLQCQVVARIVRGHESELSESEKAVLDACLPLDGLGERYQPELSDPVKDTWRTGVTGEQARAFDALTLRLALRYPADAAQAVLQIGIPYLTPGDIGRFRSLFDCGFSNIDALYPVFKPKHLFSSAIFRSTLDYFQRAPLIHLFCCGGLYAWLLLGGAGMLARSRDARRLLPAYAPALLVLVGCLFSPVAGYVRYALPFVFCAPFLTLLSARTLVRQPQRQSAQGA